MGLFGASRRQQTLLALWFYLAGFKGNLTLKSSYSTSYLTRVPIKLNTQMFLLFADFFFFAGLRPTGAQDEFSQGSNRVYQCAIILYCIGLNCIASYHSVRIISYLIKSIFLLVSYVALEKSICKMKLWGQHYIKSQVYHVVSCHEAFQKSSL